jgi:hypothetical protein
VQVLCLFSSVSRSPFPSSRLTFESPHKHGVPAEESKGIRVCRSILPGSSLGLQNVSVVDVVASF